MDEKFLSLVERIENLSNDMPRHAKIRVEKWLEKLSEPTNNLQWKRNRNTYAALLLKQVKIRTFSEPFHRLPPSDGPLPTLPQYLVTLNNKNRPTPHEHSSTISINKTSARVGYRSETKADMVDEEEQNTGYFAVRYEQSQSTIRLLEQRINQLEAELENERHLRQREKKRLRQLHEMEVNEMRRVHAQEIQAIQASAVDYKQRVKALQIRRDLNEDEDARFLDSLEEFQATSNTLLLSNR